MIELETFSIKQAAARTGLSEDTIRYYEKIQLLPPAKRNNSGRRIYESDDIDLMIFITHLKSAGMSLDTIKHYLDLSLEEDPNHAFERLAMLKGQKEKLEAQLAELQAAYKVIEYKVNLYQERVASIEKKEQKGNKVFLSKEVIL